ncbi:hypothetical protein Pelo_19403 [Pelomyxa schiedti]|nr:hypothetical protein Pelo_19403 [Pelomyxa schiedti]
MHFKLPLGMNPLNNHMSHILHIANILAWLQFPGICQADPKYDVACHHNTAIHGTLAKFPEVTSNTPNSAKTAARNFLAWRTPHPPRRKSKGRTPRQVPQLMAPPKNTRSH